MDITNCYQVSINCFWMGWAKNATWMGQRMLSVSNSRDPWLLLAHHLLCSLWGFLETALQTPGKEQAWSGLVQYCTYQHHGHKQDHKCCSVMQFERKVINDRWVTFLQVRLERPYYAIHSVVEQNLGLKLKKKKIQKTMSHANLNRFCQNKILVCNLETIWFYTGLGKQMQFGLFWFQIIRYIGK